MNLEEEEIEVLNILEENSKLTSKDISEMTGVEEEKINEIIKKLEENNYIKKYKAVVNWEKMEGEPIYASINLNVELKRESGYDKIAKRIAKFPEVDSIRLISGESDLRILIKGDSMREISDFIAEKISPLEDVRDTATHFVLKTYKKDGELFFEEHKDRRLEVSP